jgi:carbon storage regulator
MLVLTRKKEEKIIIGEGSEKIEITVLRIQGDKVSIGVKAPDSVRVLREELVNKPYELPIENLQIDLQKRETAFK